jgi:hypothetical protein
VLAAEGIDLGDLAAIELGAVEFERLARASAAGSNGSLSQSVRRS